MLRPVIGLILFSLVFIGGAYFVLSAGNGTDADTVSYSSSDRQKPVAATEKLFYNVGKMKVSETAVRDFRIANKGDKPLQLSDISTSCGCTTAQLILKDFKSKPFSMHTKSGYVTQIGPGESATVRISYMPFTMPVYGAVEREAYVKTNDPLNPRLVFTIKAFVEK